jgi:hypothetical protein
MDKHVLIKACPFFRTILAIPIETMP